MTVIKPLTPNLRKEIIDGINAQRIELDTCQNTAYVSIQKISLETVENLLEGYRTDIRSRLKGEEIETIQGGTRKED